MSCGLLLSAPRAEEAEAQKVPIDQTAQLPKESAVVLRLPSMDRLDALAKRFKAVAGMAGNPAMKQFIDAGVSNALMVQMGLDPQGFDRTQPIYLAFNEKSDEPLMLMRSAKENGITGQKQLPNGASLVVKDGLVHVGGADMLAAERRGTPLKMLDGDLAVRFLIADLVSRNKEDVDAAFEEMKKEMGQDMGQMLPMELAIDPVVAMLKGGLYGVNTIDLSATVKEDIILTQGVISTRAESGLRKMLARAGAPRENNLSDFLPGEAFLTLDFAVTPDWPGLEAAEFIKAVAGNEMGEAVMQMMTTTKQMWSMFSGRAATSITLQGMMGGNMHMLYELKEGSDASKLFEKYDVNTINETLKKIGIPMTYTFERNIAKHGETALHRISIASDDPNFQQVAMLGNSYMAAEGNHMFMVVSPNAELEIKDLIDRVRKGEGKPGVHSKAMDRLGRKRSMGMTLNLGALKPLLMFAAMMDQSGQANQFLNAMPDEMSMSTAVSMHEGDISWKGDIPIKKILKMMEDVNALRGDGGGAGDSEFD
ncbi:MAG: hypothetical protein AAGD14_05120 [Planctomycetota bacterium]